MDNRKTNAQQSQVERPAPKLSRTGRVIMAIIAVLIGLGVLRGYRTHWLEEASRQPGYEWRSELRFSDPTD